MHEHKRLRTKYSQTAHNCSINVQNVRFDSLAINKYLEKNLNTFMSNLRQELPKRG